jgi:hypothetical protein
MVVALQCDVQLSVQLLSVTNVQQNYSTYAYVGKVLQPYVTVTHKLIIIM